MSSRIASFGVGMVMVVAAAMHLENGFFMNWAGSQAGEGYEYHLLAIAIAVVVIIKGGGRWSVDGILSKE